ncbi:MAG: amidohydrolase family protein [Dethiobacter sp.]|jgi:imidazolonepropionase-like amidohydrolase|nr:amidohydrolase family protein [Dethiobacter sp.]
MYDLLIYNARIFTLDEQGTIETGYLLIKEGKFVKVGEGLPPDVVCTQRLDADNMLVMPGLADCHTHLMEYATSEIHWTQGQAQKMAGTANLLTALKCGIVALGEHHLGHPVLIQPHGVYKTLMNDAPLDVRLACGCCFIGTEPMALVSSIRPGEIIAKEDLTEAAFLEMADKSDFPGENIFLNATVANLPFDAAPRAGELTFSFAEIKKIVSIFHAQNKKIGAHIEGDEAARMFIDAGGDVICHGHALSSSLIDLIAEKRIPVVITPHGGTSSRPTSPAEVYRFYKKGVKLAIATDSYLPVHPKADWIDLPAGTLVGPQDFLTIAKPAFDYLLGKGVETEEVLKLITINGLEIMNLADDAGSIAVGNKADLIISRKIPVVETTDVQDIKYVIKNGEILVAKPL